jgi:hypothetical protein
VTVDLPDDSTFIIAMLMEIRDDVKTILSLLEENDEENDHRS